MEIQNFKKFSDMNSVDRISEVMNTMQQSFGTDNVYLKWALIITCIAVIISFLTIFSMNIKNIKQDIGYFIAKQGIVYFIAIALSFTIIFNLMYAFIVACTTIGTGYYKADVKVQNIKTVENVSGKKKTTFEIKDDNNQKLKLDYQGHKLSKRDKIQVKTQKEILNDNAPKQKAFDLLSKDKYTYSYQGHNIKSNDVRELGRGIMRNN